MIRAIILKEIRHIMRDPRSLLILLALPIFLLIMFGYAISLDVKNIGFAVWDGDRSEYSRRFVENFLHTEYFRLKYHIDRPQEADALVMNEMVQIVILIPRGFQESIMTGGSATVQVIIDGSNPTIGGTAAGYIEMIGGDFLRSGDVGVTAAATAQVFAAASNPLATSGGGPRLPVDVAPRIWFNPELSSARFLVPGLVTFILMVSAVVSTSLSIVREKERGTIEQIMISPVSPAVLLLGKTVPYFCLALFNSSLVMLASYFFFGISIRGSYLVFFGVTLVFLFGCLSLGILISTFVDSQQNAFMAAVFLTVLPSYILSGFIFPIRNMPFLIQLFTYLVPNRYFIAAVRAIMIRGSGIESFLPEFVSLCIFDAAVASLAVLRLKFAGRK